MSRFQTDDVQQKAVRDAVLGPGLYGVFAMEGRYVYIDKGQLASILQKRFAVDTVLQSMTGGAAFIEEKIVRWPRSNRAYTMLTLETKSCTVAGHESDGWMVYGQADWLNYAMCQRNGNVLCYLIDFPKLKEAFWENSESFDRTVSRQHNQTECRLVPLSWVNEQVGSYCRLVHATPEGAEIVKAFNETHYLRNGDSKQKDWIADTRSHPPGLRPQP